MAQLSVVHPAQQTDAHSASLWVAHLVLTIAANHIMAVHTTKSNLKCQELLDDTLASIAIPTVEGIAASMDNDECSQGLVCDDLSVESDTGYSSTGYAIHDEDNVQIIETLNDETEDGCSSVDEKDARIAEANPHSLWQRNRLALPWW